MRTLQRWAIFLANKLCYFQEPFHLPVVLASTFLQNCFSASNQIAIKCCYKRKFPFSPTLPEEEARDAKGRAAERGQGEGNLSSCQDLGVS